MSTDTAMIRPVLHHAPSSKEITEKDKIGDFARNSTEGETIHLAASRAP